MNDIATQLADAHLKWLVVCGKTTAELNLEEHQFSPVKFDPVFDRFYDELEKIENQLVSYKNIHWKWKS